MDKKTSVNVPPIRSQEIINELGEEINNMLSYAIYNGVIINTKVR
jgi:hypothetical protein